MQDSPTLRDWNRLKITVSFWGNEMFCCVAHMYHKLIFQNRPLRTDD